jgi:hypothetical protein
MPRAVPVAAVSTGDKVLAIVAAILGLAAVASTGYIIWGL